MNTKFTTYVIESSSERKYIGQTDDLEKRLAEHNSGKSVWTKRFSDWRVVYKKEFDSRKEARKWENYLKSQKGGNGLKKIIQRAS